MNYLNHPRLQTAGYIVRAGGVVAYPTEAVWGLGCLPWDDEAVAHILKLKQRPVEKGLILIGSDLAQFDFLLEGLAPAQLQRLQSTWPGPTTWLVPHRNRIPAWVSGSHDTVAIRVTAHPAAAALCQKVGAPLISTSANPQGLAPARFGYRARQYFGGAVAYAPGQVDLSAKPSTIIDLSSDRVLRS